MSKPLNTNDQNVALSGYDVVSYYQDGPQKGDASISTQHDGATYLFANEANRDAFVANPAQYLPEYGGYCATAMSEGKIFEVDPENFKVSGDALYLFYKGEAGDTLPEWNADEQNRRASADTHWANDTYAAHA